MSGGPASDLDLKEQNCSHMCVQSRFLYGPQHGPTHLPDPIKPIRLIHNGRSGGEGIHYSQSHMGKGGISFVRHIISEQFICYELK